MMRNGKSTQSNNSVKAWFSRRNLLATLTLAVSGSAVAATGKPHRGSKEDRRAHHKEVGTAVAKQQIAELRCQYAIATDLIGTLKPEAVAAGRKIYHRIFRPDASIGASGQDSVTGPDAWVDIVMAALKVYEKTQHLIGTQVVSIDSLPGEGSTGKASMTSYLQAWHAKADGELWLFMGTYTDHLSHSPEHGWQIADMVLEQVSGETRKLGTA